MKQKLLEEFAWYLHLNNMKGYTLEYMGETLDISEYINTDLSKVQTETIKGIPFEINVVVWNSNIREFEYITETNSTHSDLSISSKEARQRIDIFLYTQRIREDSSSEMLIIELKAQRLISDKFQHLVIFSVIFFCIGSSDKWLLK